jgi:hypothetical protein
MILTSENDNTRRQTCPGAILSTTNPTWTGLGMKECLMKTLDNPVTTGHYRPLLFRDGMLQRVLVVFYVCVSVHHNSILYKEPTRYNFGSTVY